jgi:hypothetical protein
MDRLLVLDKRATINLPAPGRQILERDQSFSMTWPFCSREDGNVGDVEMHLPTHGASSRLDDAIRHVRQWFAAPRALHNSNLDPRIAR